MNKVCIVAGGTGGHIFPAVSMAHALFLDGYSVTFITDERGRKYIQSDNLDMQMKVMKLHIPRNTIMQMLKSMISISIEIISCVRFFIRNKQDIILSFGGYPSIAPSIASVLIGIPLIIHEQNAIIGKANRFLSRFAKVISTAYQKTKNINNKYRTKVLFTGSIVRKSVFDISHTESKAKSNIFTIFIIGGSQGAKIFSTLIPESIKLLQSDHHFEIGSGVIPNPRLNQTNGFENEGEQTYTKYVRKAEPRKIRLDHLKMGLGIKLHIIQQASSSDHHTIEQIYQSLNISYELKEFFNDVDQKYLQADLLIARSGASTIAEITHIGLPAILIPYPFSADNHQLYNAKDLSGSGSAWYFEQQNLTPPILASKLQELISNRLLLQNARDNLLQRKVDGVTSLKNVLNKLIQHA